MGIVEAVGVSVSSLNKDKKDISKLREKAMSDAVLKASEQGITEPEKVKELMLQAYKEV